MRKASQFAVWPGIRRAARSLTQTLRVGWGCWTGSVPLALMRSRYSSENSPQRGKIVKGGNQTLYKRFSNRQQRNLRRTTMTCLTMMTTESWMKGWVTRTHRLKGPLLETMMTTTISSCLQQAGCGTEAWSWMTRTLWVSESKVFDWY